jgi:hypothetical protein
MCAERPGIEAYNRRRAREADEEVLSRLSQMGHAESIRELAEAIEGRSYGSVYKAVGRLSEEGRVVVEEYEDEELAVTRKLVFPSRESRDEYFRMLNVSRAVMGEPPAFFRTLYDLFSKIAGRDDRVIRGIADENGVTLEGVMGFLVDLLTRVLGKDIDALSEEQKRAEAYLGIDAEVSR